MNKPNPMRLDPKAAFLAKTPLASSHADYMASPMFHEAATLALVKYQFSLGQTAPEAAAVSAFKMRGAKEFLDVLMGFGEPDKEPTYAGSPNLQSPERDPNDFWKQPKS